MPEPQVLPLSGYKSGWITRVPARASEFPDDGFSEAQNIALDEKFIPTKDNGHEKYNSSGIASANTRGGFLYAMSDGTKYYVIACNGKLWYSTVGSGTFTAYQIGGNDLTITSTKDVGIVQYNDCLWIINGEYPIITNGGYATSKMIKISGTTPTEITVADLPQAGEEIAVHIERIFILKGNSLYWSEPYNPEDWTPEYGLNYDYVGKDDGEVATGIKSFQGFLYVGKPKNIYRYMTVGDITEWGSQRVDTRFGWMHSRTIQEFFGKLIYWSPEGVALFDGNNAVLISEQIRPTMEQLPQLETNIRQWLQDETADFDTGTVNDVIDTAYNQVKILQQTTQAHWQAGVSMGVATPSTGNVEDLKTLPSHHAGCWSVKVGNYIYQGEQTSDKFWRYSIVNNVWEEMEPNGYTLGAGDLASDGGDLIYFISPNNYFLRYSIAGDTWERLTMSCHKSRTLVFVGTYFYALCYDIATVGLWRYTVGSDSWTFMGASSYTPTVYSAMTFDAGGYIYAIVGNGLMKYDIVGDSWNTLENVPVSTSQGSHIVKAGSYLYIFDGGTSKKLRKYDISGDSWSDLGAIPDGCWGGSFVYDGTNLYAVLYPYYRLRQYNLTYTTWDRRFYSQTLDYITALTAFGYILADVVGTFTFQVKTSDTDLSEANWLNTADWIVAQNNETDCTLTPKRYTRFRVNFPEDGVLKAFCFGKAEFISVKKDLGAAPSAWGRFVSSYSSAGQTVTFWMRGAATEGGVDGATWFQQTPGTNVTGFTVYQWIQYKLVFSTTVYAQQPYVDNIIVNYYSSTSIVNPCSVVWKNDYWLNVADVGSTKNDLVLRFNKAGYWLPRTNKHNNVYFVDGNKLISGTSDADGFVRINDVGTKDDTTDIDSYFVTKDYELAHLIKIFRGMFVSSRSDADWTLSYSVDGSAYTDVTVTAQSAVETVKKVFAGIVRGQFIKFKIRQNAEDAHWEFHGVPVIWEGWRELVVDA